MVLKVLFTIFFFLLFLNPANAQGWPKPLAPAIPEADGFVIIPNAAIAPDPKISYRAVFDGTRFAANPKSILPVINAVGGVLNDLMVAQVPKQNREFVVIFHGPAVDGILDDAHYRAKYGIANPNTKVLTALRKMGVSLLVCGQHLAAEHIDPKILSTDVTVASDAYLVLINYQNRRFALMSF